MLILTKRKVEKVVFVQYKELKKNSFKAVKPKLKTKKQIYDYSADFSISNL